MLKTKNKIKYIRFVGTEKKNAKKNKFLWPKGIIGRRFIGTLPLQVTDCHFQLAENEPLCHGQRNY